MITVNDNSPDNIDTRSALDSLRELVGATHVYLRQTQASPRASPLLASAARYVTDVLHIFGAVEGPRGGVGFPVGDGDSGCVSKILRTETYKSSLLASAARYVTDVLHLIGAVEDTRKGFGFPVGDSEIKTAGHCCSLTVVL